MQQIHANVWFDKFHEVATLFLVGFADVNAILTNKKLQQKFGQKSMKDLRKIVHSGDKKRFELKQFGSVWKIKAVDKHSVKVLQ